jgi:hypothetical protein
MLQKKITQPSLILPNTYVKKANVLGYIMADQYITMLTI